jgi:hypothetical protein
MSSLEPTLVLTALTTVGKCDVGYSNISMIGLLKSPLNYANFIGFSSNQIRRRQELVAILLFSL